MLVPFITLQIQFYIHSLFHDSLYYRDHSEILIHFIGDLPQCMLDMNVSAELTATVYTAVNFLCIWLMIINLILISILYTYLLLQNLTELITQCTGGDKVLPHIHLSIVSININSTYCM